MQEKKDIRREILRKRIALNEEELHFKSEAICQAFMTLPGYQNTSFIYIYMDFKNEVMTKSIITNAHQTGKKVAIPRICNNEMNFYLLEEGQELDIGYFGIREPEESTLVQNSEGIMIVPGIAFDEAGYRIGYGKGYYDRFLHNNQVKEKIALAFELQLVDQVPYDKHDIPMDMIITENRIIQV
jgi:5-formyltetrahydrofolate cyclo-ligase